MHASVAAHSASTVRVLSLLLLAAHTLFLWMFFAADGVAQIAAAGGVSAPPGPELELLAERFAAQWKHGMADNSPLYMPGFFAVGLLTWLWSIGRRLPRLAAEWVVIAAAATVLGAAFAPRGASLAIAAFERSSGLVCAGAAPGLSLVSAWESAFTLLTWTAGIYCLQLSIARRSVAPMAVPVVLNYLLLRLRPWAVNDYATPWLADLSRGHAVAILSLVAIPVLMSGLVLYQLGREGTGPLRRRAPGERGA